MHAPEIFPVHRMHPGRASGAGARRAGLPVERLRVVFLCDATRDRNGVGTYYGDLTDHLATRMAAAVLIAPRAEGRGRHQGAGLPLPGDPTQRLWLPALGPVLRTVRRTAPHLIVAALPGPYGGLGLLLARRLVRPLCIGFHTRYASLTELYWRSGPARLLGTVIAQAERRFLRSGDAVVANSRPMAAAGRIAGARAVYTVGTPIAKPLLARPRKPISGRLARVLFAGRLAAEKNVAAVLQAARRLPEVRFCIAGDGPLREAVQRAAREQQNIEAPGWVARERLAILLDRTDLLVLPSHEEAFGTAALEAMARERMVLVSHRCGIVNWPALAPGVFVMRPGETVTNALMRIAANASGANRECARRARIAAEAFNESCLADWLGVLTRLAGDAAPV